ncbi:4a-hydroxytetrahydrobiopterin dehydratase [Candidatus Nomurabacteria bacterium]|nr:4a-hydroxytetrahydrobiopterin dehydratase [Candidatus Nomurabacteria bacterium]
MQWKDKDNFLEKNFSFDTFVQAMIFVNRIADIAEQLNHHPEISIHDYNQVRIQTTTHSEGKITQKDYDLAERVDSVFFEITK